MLHHNLLNRRPTGALAERLGLRARELVRRAHIEIHGVGIVHAVAGLAHLQPVGSGRQVGGAQRNRAGRTGG